jgi:hypothetical protein
VEKREYFILQIKNRYLAALFFLPNAQYLFHIASQVAGLELELEDHSKIKSIKKKS